MNGDARAVAHKVPNIMTLYIAMAVLVVKLECGV